MSKPADFYEYDLKANAPVTRYQEDFKTKVDVVDKGSIVGKIYSYHLDSSNNVWWILYETYKPGHSMFVKHDPNALYPLAPSGTVVKVTVPGVLTDLTQAASNAAGSLFGNVFTYAKWGLLAFVGYKAIQLFKSK